VSLPPDRLPALLKLHAADPLDAELCYMIALEETKHDRDAQAVAWFDKALAIQPATHYAYFQKAKAQSRLGLMEEAQATADAGISRAQADGHAKALGELQELRRGLNES